MRSVLEAVALQRVPEQRFVPEDRPEHPVRGDRGDQPRDQRTELEVLPVCRTDADSSAPPAAPRRSLRYRSRCRSRPRSGRRRRTGAATGSATIRSRPRSVRSDPPGHRSHRIRWSGRWRRVDGHGADPDRPGIAVVRLDRRVGAVPFRFRREPDHQRGRDERRHLPPVGSPTGGRTTRPRPSAVAGGRWRRVPADPLQQQTPRPLEHFEEQHRAETGDHPDRDPERC